MPRGVRSRRRSSSIVRMLGTRIRTFRGRSRLTSLDALRGVASFAVAWFHFTNGNPRFLPAGPLRSSGAFGWLGVEVFFVISGFVIPYSLWRSHYRLGDFGRFVLKRVARLDPPYLTAIALILALGWLSAQLPGYGGAPFAISWTQLTLHFAYLNAFAGGDTGPYPWLNPVFWTLAIEFQFYLSVGVLYPIFAVPRRRGLALVVAVACLALAAIVPSPAIVAHYAPLFLIGIALFQYRAGVIGGRAAAVVLLTLAVATALLLGPVVAAAGLLTAFAIVAFETKHGALHRVLTFLGGISYSLYLLHVPVGGRIVNLGVRYAHSAPARWLVLAAAVVVSIATAWAFARIIEHPAQRFASRIALHERPTPDDRPAADAAGGGLAPTSAEAAVAP